MFKRSKRALGLSRYFTQFGERLIQGNSLVFEP